MDLSQINLVAVLVAALSTFAVGFAWYSPPVFGRVWMRANGFSEEDARRGNPALVFGGSLVLSLIMAFNLAMFLGPAPGVGWGAAAGALAGGGWVATGFGVIYLFEHRPLSLWLVNGGYHLVAFTAMGAIIGAWP